MSRKTKKSSIKFIVTSLITIALLVVGFLVLKYINFSSKLNKVELDRDYVTNIGKLASNPNDDITNIAILGSDAPEGYSSADTALVLSINKKTNKVKILSFMKDISLMLPDGDTSRLDQTLLEGGPELLLKTLNYNFDLNIDKFVHINLNSLPKIVNQIGGVQGNITAEDLYMFNLLILEIGKEYNVEQIFSGGSRTLTGIQALAYCRLDEAKNNPEILGQIFNNYSSNISSFASDLLPVMTTNMKTTEFISAINKTEKAAKSSIPTEIFPLDGDYNNSSAAVDNRVINIEATKTAIHNFINK